MGMFDDIKYEAPCPFCGEPVTGWQSKDGSCVLAKLTPSELYEQVPWTGRESRYEPVTFYSSCKGCKAWVEVKMSAR